MEGAVWVSAAAQKPEIAELMKKQPTKGEAWYLIDRKWLQQWKRYVGYDHWDTGVIGEASANPGPIDNSALFEGDIRTLRKNLVEEVEYTALPAEAWNKLCGWYGLLPGQEPIKRHVIEQGIFLKRCRLEVYLLELRLCTCFQSKSIVVKSFSLGSKVESLVVSMRSMFHIAQHRKVRLWLQFMSSSYQLVNRFDCTLQDANVYSGQLVIIDTQLDDGTYSAPAGIIPHVSTKITTPAKPVANTHPAMSCAKSVLLHNVTAGAQSKGLIARFDSLKHNHFPPGLCGLTNIGNTCFMNAALQCMSNVPSLTKYMLSDRWDKELNTHNPLGTGGQIARKYVALIRSMWSGNETYVTPHDIKAAVGKFKPEFSGFQPQDSHELLAFLLDGLHEDLNRIKVKPYTVLNDANDRPDKEVASEVWADYIRRNDSIIVDTFHGLLKSTIVCPQCGKVSVKFDPFGYLSLPLPMKSDRKVEVTLVSTNPCIKPCQFSVSVSTTGTVAELCIALSQLADVAPERMLAVEVYRSHFHRIFLPEDRIDGIMDSDNICIYEVPSDVDGDMLLVPVYMREGKASAPTTHSLMKPEKRRSVMTYKFFGPPILVAVRKDSCTYKDLFNAILRQTARYVGVRDVASAKWRSFASMEDTSDQERMDDGTDDNNGANVNQNAEMVLDDATKVRDVRDDSRSSHSLPLFTLFVVSSTGNTDNAELKDDGKPITFPDHPYVAAHWNSLTRNLFYDEKEASAFIKDVSMAAETVSSRKECTHLRDCLELFTSKERLGDYDFWSAYDLFFYLLNSHNPGSNRTDDEWYCSNCRMSQQATKKFDLWQLPRVLIVHLKRFSFSESRRDKLDMFVEFPVKGLDLTKWIINDEHQPAIYDLLAVTNHIGKIGGGHYTAYAKNKEDGEWHQFDDAVVKNISEDEIVTQEGYILVYQMRGDADKGASGDSGVAMETN